MRIIVWGINYAPELTGIAPYNVALCEFLRRRGHPAEMVTTFSYYPMWRKRKEDSGLLYRRDVLNGVPVHRCWHFVPAKISAWKRILHEGTFVLTSTLRALWLERADCYIIVSPPLLLGLAAWLVTKLKGSRFIFHVQDLQPDAAIGLGMLRQGWFTRALYRLESFAYNSATRVSGISEEMLGAFRRKGVRDQKLLFFPNGVVLPDEANLPARGKFRARHNVSPNEFVAVYAGNLGVKQGLGVLLEAAESLRHEAIRILICGDGAERRSLARRVSDRSLTNVTMLPLQASDNYAELLVDADVCLITQQTGSGNAFLPSKLLTTLAYAKPVVTVADSESALAGAVNSGGFGINVRPNNPTELANVLSGLARDRSQLVRWGRAGRGYVEQFEQDRVLEVFLTELKSLGSDSIQPNRRCVAE